MSENLIRDDLIKNQNELINKKVEINEQTEVNQKIHKNERLEEFERYIIGKKIAIIGLGVSNIPLLDYFYTRKAKVTIFDKREKEVLDKEALKKIEQYHFELYTGENALSHLVGFSLIFRSPSCMPDTKEIVEEVERGAILTTEIEMLLKLCPATVIGITGTEGKTTTSSIIYSVVQSTGRRCYLGGNIGKPLFTEVGNMTKDDIVVLELSSFQLIDMDVSPQISVVTNIYPDHLDVHKSYEEYREAKKNIFKYQDSNGILVLNYDNEFTREFAKEANGKVIFFSSKEKLENGYIYDNTDGVIKYCKDGLRRHIIKKQDIKLRGIHNYENICAVLAATSSIVDIEKQTKAIKEFNGVEHRLEFVRELNGVKWYNDSIGTSPASTIAGLKSFDENIILLAGGSDKGLDYSEVGRMIAEKVGTLILTGPTSSKIEEATKAHLNGKKIEFYYCSNMQEAVKLANEVAKSGDVVLLSPASASFDLYKNFADRGNKFKDAVKQL